MLLFAYRGRIVGLVGLSRIIFIINMIVCFDLETTGLDKYNDKIIEISMIKFDENTFEVIDTYSSFIDPWVSIPEIISNITNIFDGDLIWAPKIDDLKQDILNFIWNSVLLWHNVDFDIDFLVNSWINVFQKVIFPNLLKFYLEVFSFHYYSTNRIFGHRMFGHRINANNGFYFNSF